MITARPSTSAPRDSSRTFISLSLLPERRISSTSTTGSPGCCSRNCRKRIGWSSSSLSAQYTCLARSASQTPYATGNPPVAGGLPVAYGVCEALRAKQVYWAERDDEDQPMRFRQFLEQHPGEPVVLVDDILRSGSKLSEMKVLLESRGALVLGLAVIIYQPTP